MIVLGLGGSNHDFSSCIVKDGIILSMIEDERITRNKYGIGLGIELGKGYSRKYCLNEANVTLEEVDLIVANDIISKLMYSRMKKEVVLINHHLSHIASAFYPSEFQEAAILVVDSVGSKIEGKRGDQYESISFANGKGNKIEILDKQYGYNLPGTDYVENSLGIFYSIITQIIGFNEHEEGKTMGLAPYGTDTYYQMLKKHIRFIGDGKIEMTSDDINELLGYRDFINSHLDEDKKNSVRADFAYACQCILEEAMLYLVRHLYKLTKCDNLCITGGVGLNSVANYKIYKQGPFKNIFIQPAAGDNGTGIGSALYGYYGILNNKRII